MSESKLAVANRRGGGLLSRPRLAPVAKFLSTSFEEPIGPRFSTDSVKGYFIDLRVKAKSPDWPAGWSPRHRLWVGLTQLGLGAYERYLAGEGEQWLNLARTIGDALCDNQVTGGARDGALEHHFDYPHTFSLQAPWVSSISQGQAASLLVRLHLETGLDPYAEAAARALKVMSVAIPDGGVMALLDGRPFPQEYPTQPASFVLNGGIFSIWGWRDVGRGLSDQHSAATFDEAVDTLAMNVHRWDLGYWSRYDLYPHPVVNVASLAYQRLVINQLRVMASLAPRTEFVDTANTFEAYLSSSICRARAFAGKVIFRLRVPRRRHVTPRPA